MENSGYSIEGSRDDEPKWPDSNEAQTHHLENLELSVGHLALQAASGSRKIDLGSSIAMPKGKERYQSPPKYQSMSERKWAQANRKIGRDTSGTVYIIKVTVNKSYMDNSKPVKIL